MKAKVKLLGFVGLVVFSLATLAQDNPSAAANVSPAAAPAEAVSAAAPAAAPDVGGVIPLIQYVDVPLTTAMDNLARQAGLNYILDPKVGFGQPGADGKPVPQPTISVRWENLTAEQALTAMLNNYDLQIVEDPKTKTVRISKKDPAAPDPIVTKIIQLKFSSTSNMVSAVQSALSDKRSKVVADNRTSQLVVLATDKEMVAVDELIARLDTKSKQVLIEAQLMEVSTSPSTQKGINWAGTFKGQNVTFGNGVTKGTYSESDGRNRSGNSSMDGSFSRSGNSSLDGTRSTISPGTPTTTELPGGRTVTTTPASSTSSKANSIFGNSSSSSLAGSSSGSAANSMSSLLDTITAIGGGGLTLNTASGLTPAVGFLNADGLRAAISFFNEQADTKVLSTPRTVTLDNEPTFIEVGTMWPIVNVSASTANTTGGSQISYTNLTLRLDVTPSISAEDFVNLKVHPSVMRLGPKVATKVADQENVVDSFYKRDIETRVLIPSGNTLVLGGLVTDELMNESSKVPILGDIPYLGYAFRYKSKARDKRNLIVFITPTIVQDEDFQPNESSYLKTPPPNKDTLEGDWSTFDSTEPKDWSKPRDPAKSKEAGKAQDAGDTVAQAPLSSPKAQTQ